jgi:predicted metal-dependent hydrolase
VIRKTKQRCQSREIFRSQRGPIQYLWKRSSARRTLNICVDGKGGLSVLSPWTAPQSAVEAFLEEKARWIDVKVREARRNHQLVQSRIFDHGQEFWFLGRKFPVTVRLSEVIRPRFHFTGREWVAVIPEALRHDEPRRRDAVRKKLIAWYRRQAGEILAGRVFHYSREMGITPRKIAVRTQKRMWGCCDFNTQTIRLNWQIVMSPLSVIDYVVVHEMCHLWEPNHSRRFWEKVRKFIPDFESAKTWLKLNFLELALPGEAAGE